MQRIPPQAQAAVRIAEISGFLSEGICSKAHV